MQKRKWSSLTVSASFGKNWKSTHTLSSHVATFFEACRSAVLGPFHVASKYGGKGPCSESVMTVAARMALTSLWHGNYGGVSRLGPLWRALSDMVLEQHPLIFSASVLQSLPFEDGAVTNHHHLSITLSSNGPHQTRQMKFIVACFVHVWCWHEIASAQLELRGGSFMFSAVRAGEGRHRRRCSLSRIKRNKTNMR